MTGMTEQAEDDLFQLGDITGQQRKIFLELPLELDLLEWQVPADRDNFIGQGRSKEERGFSPGPRRRGNPAAHLQSAQPGFVLPTFSVGELLCLLG